MKHTIQTAGTAAIALALGVSLAGALPGAAIAKSSAKATTPKELSCPAAQIEANKELARLFDIKLDPKIAYEHMDPGYIQHNPMAKRIGDVNGVSGRDEFKLLLDLKDKGIGGRPPELPGQPPEDTYHFVMATCDHVFLLKKSYPPDPQHPGQFYEAFDFDLWRVENGKLVEHWDGARIPNPPPAIITMPVAELLKAKGARPAGAPPAGGPPAGGPPPGPPPAP
ncbi:hypothetical protein WSK_2310 [Novosphingobium sp. Rr 2-17]|uniref:nuclear transport factor 2 family protein n=1 Tax=Novosphingobium sp. Rr 2-17 TaxID=555793 RepID=UPI0002699ECB|nr:hypothetical protein [Novosphingobium sp. Rr 2-17]EIZ79123.1 hypothetical protein WSK_2310 [Novosphingobium sp. Rr 2-17]